MNFEKEFYAANTAYYGPDETAAINAVVAFVAKAEQHEDSARKTKDLNFDSVLGMAWLRLAAFYEMSGHEEQRSQAMAKAIRYFDRLGAFTRDSKYSANKEGALKTMLSETEKSEMPAWKKKRIGST